MENSTLYINVPHRIPQEYLLLMGLVLLKFNFGPLSFLCQYKSPEVLDLINSHLKLNTGCYSLRATKRFVVLFEYVGPQL